MRCHPEEEDGSPATQAGSHPFQLTTTLMLNMRTAALPQNAEEEAHLETQPLALTKDLRFNLPAGLIGNPTPMPKCSIYVFEQEVRNIPGFECPPETVLGVATPVLDFKSATALVNPLYSLEPAPGEPARFGFEGTSGVPVILDTSVRTGGDYGVVVTVHDITELAAFLGCQVTFWGAPSDPRHDSQRGRGCLDRLSALSRNGP